MVSSGSLRERLAKFYPVSVFGGTPPLKRDRLAHTFRTKGHCRVFIGQILAAGVANSFGGPSVR